MGRKDAPGRPVMFGTTDGFLKRFQISSLDELPDYDMLLESIRGADSKDNYLFRKDEYDENSDPEFMGDSSVPFEENILPVDGGADSTNSSPEDFELKDIEDEDIPDFLKDEEVTKIS